MIQLRLTKAVKVLLVLNLAMFIIQKTSDQFLGGNLLTYFSLIPATFALKFWVWQIVTYAFLHGDVWHLFFNLLMLAFIGGDLEAVWGTRRFVTYYLFCAAVAGFCYLFMQMFVFQEQGIYTPLVGASGSIYGLLIAYGILFSERTLLFMLLFPMKAKHFIWILAGIEFMTTVFSPGGALSSIAHLGGMAGGFIFLWVRARMLIARRERGERPKKRPSHLKLVHSSDDEEGGGGGSSDPSDPKTWH